MDVRWVKIRSWHAVLGVADGGGDFPGVYQTRCGLLTMNLPVDDLPAERSCESCLRIIARKGDA
jgi:hypothetical protein